MGAFNGIVHNATGLADHCTGSNSWSYTYNGEQVTNNNTPIYQNGIKLTTTGGSASDGLIASDPNYYIGSKWNGMYYEGNISESLFYSRLLSQSEVVENDRYMQRKWAQVEDNSKAPGGVHHGLVLWLDADDSTSLSTAACTSTVSSPSASNRITCWKDKSGRENHVSSDAGSPSYETNEFNTKPVIRFTGSQNMTVSDLIGMQGGDEPFTVFAVANTSQTGTGSDILAFGDSHTNAKESWQMRMDNSSEYLSLFEDANVKSDSNPTIIFGETAKHAVISMSYNGEGVKDTSNQLIYQNGALLSTIASLTSTGDASIAATPKLAIGSGVEDNNIWQGDIAEVIIYTRMLSDAERQDVEAYLAQKWMDEPYYRSCADSGSGTFTLDSDGYNGPSAPVSTVCP